MARRALPVLIILAITLPITAQTPKSALPDPVKFVTKYDIAWNVVRSVLTSMDYAIELEDKKGGRIITKPSEFITGSLTGVEVAKVAVNNSGTGTLLKARHTVEGLLEIVSATETLITIRTKMEALNRELDGTEKWVPLESLGTYEKRILGKISLKLLGNELQFDEKKGFWDKSPQPVNPRRPKP